MEKKFFFLAVVPGHALPRFFVIVFPVELFFALRRRVRVRPVCTQHDTLFRAVGIVDHRNNVTDFRHLVFPVRQHTKHICYAVFPVFVCNFHLSCGIVDVGNFAKANRVFHQVTPPTSAALTQPVTFFPTGVFPQRDFRFVILYRPATLIPS